MSLTQQLATLQTVIINQRKELIELLGVETRNKYSIETEDGQVLGFAAEQQKGFFGLIFRQALGHWRTYDINIYGPERELEFVAHHPFRFYYQRIEVKTAAGAPIGRLERRFEIFGKRFDLIDNHGNVLFTVRSPLWRIWTFPFRDGVKEYAVVSKKWGGVLKEVFLDADTFALRYISPDLTDEQRILLLAAALYIDLRYFEKKASGSSRSIFNTFNN